MFLGSGLRVVEDSRATSSFLTEFPEPQNRKSETAVPVCWVAGCTLAMTLMPSEGYWFPVLAGAWCLGFNV